MGHAWGIKRNSISFEDIESLYKGCKITRTIHNRFFKSLVNLNIAIKDTKVTIEFNPDKKLVNNQYIPLNVYNVKNTPILYRYVHYMNKYIKLLIFIINRTNYIIELILNKIELTTNITLTLSFVLKT